MADIPNQLKNEIAQRVRGNVIYAAIGAALLIYFGWFYASWNWDIETWSGRGIGLIMIAMRAGGILMGLAALFCMTGVPAALLLDSLTTLAVGVSLTLGAVLFFKDGGTNALLYLILGLFLSNSGYRSWQDYRALTALANAEKQRLPTAPPPKSVARPAIPSPVLPVPNPSSNRVEPTSPVATEPPKPAPASPPPDGYLAAFGRDDSNNEGA